MFVCDDCDPRRILFDVVDKSRDAVIGRRAAGNGTQDDDIALPVQQ